MSSTRASRWTFLLLSIVTLALMVILSRDFGVTWDEKGRSGYGAMVFEFLTGQRSRASLPTDDGQYYGALFDVLCVFVSRFVRADPFVVRHVINALFGWLGIVYCGRLAARLFGGWAGVLAFVLLAASPRYFADSMNNPKDLPFAALVTVALYYVSTITPTWPYLSWGTAAKIAIPLALALNVRAAALLFAVYFGALVAAYLVVDRQTDVRRLGLTVAKVGGTVLATLVLGTAVWPWAQLSPLIRPIQALRAFSNFSWDGGVIFAGQDYIASRLPWYYAPTWLLITTPLVVMIGFVLMLVYAYRRGWLWPCAALLAAAGAPFAAVIVNHSRLYDGIRHLLFIYPLLVVLAAAGWVACFESEPRRWVRVTAAAILAWSLITVVTFDIRAHPNQNVYFNEFVGGPRGAFTRYDLDYWGNCMLQGIEWSAAQARLAGMPLSVSGNPLHLVQLDGQRFPELVVVPLGRGVHHFDIRLNRGPIAGITELANRGDALYQVRTPDGAVLCAVFPGPAYESVRPRLARHAGTP